MGEIREGSADRISAGEKEETKAFHLLGIYRFDCYQYICQLLISKGSNCVMSVYTLRDLDWSQAVLYSFLLIMLNKVFYDSYIGVSLPLPHIASGLLR